MAKTLNKKNIEAIFPLTSTQQNLLFHSLSSSFDQGFLNLQCDLEGTVDPVILEQAWNIVVQRHAILRTTVHWKKIEKPVQIVHKNKSVAFEPIDWKSFSSADKEKKWEEIKNENRANGVDFTKGALLDVKLVQLEANFYRLLWTNHHLLLDGWSSNNILNDVFNSYESLLSKNIPLFEVLPTHKSYLRWVSQNKPAEAQMFWERYFEGKKSTNVFNPVHKRDAKSITVERGLTEQDTNELKKFAKQSKVTLNVVVQGIWSLLLFKYFNVTDATHGTTVSGRSSDFKNIELLSGMYSKVHPVRNFIENEEKLTEWIGKIQKRQLNASKYEHLDLEEIMPYATSDISPLFDSLLIFENFPVVRSDTGTVVVSNFKSGVTSTYPITMVVLPGKNLHMVLTVLSAKVKDEMAEWLLSSFIKITKLIISSEVEFVATLLEKVEAYVVEDELSKEQSKDKLEQDYMSPRNDLEKQLVNVWEEVFKIKDIGVHDNFFSLGGKSLIAVKIFTKLSKENGFKLAPTILLEHPTIAEIAKLVNDDEEDTSEKLKFLIPLRKTGSKVPLFCVHAGGGHVFFYNDLVKHLSQDRPVYALQPSGIDGKNKMHNSIAEMTSDYLHEIKRVQTNGPYHILAYCFGTAVGIEMIRQLKETNETAHIIIMDTMALQEKTTANRLVMRTENFVKRFSHNPFKSLLVMTSDRTQRYLKPFWVNLFGSTDDKSLEALKQNLVTIYRKFEWIKFVGQIDLLLTKKASERLNTEIIDSWQNLTDEVTIRRIEGNHRTLFEEPDVIWVGAELEESMSFFESKHNKSILPKT